MTPDARRLTPDDLRVPYGLEYNTPDHVRATAREWELFAKGDVMAFRDQQDIGQSFLEYAIMLVLIAVIVVAVLLIVGDDVRVFVRDLLQTWFPPSP